MTVRQVAPPTSPSGKGKVSAHVSVEGARDIDFRSLTEAIDTLTSCGHLVFHIFAALTQFAEGGTVALNWTDDGVTLFRD